MTFCHRFFGFTAALVLIAIAGCKSTPTATSSSEAVLKSGIPITLLYQQGREGQIEPCGCHTYPFGGIDRELNAIQAIRKARGAEILSVDAGNLFAPEKLVSPAQFYRERGDLLVKVLNEHGVQVFGPGPADYALGLDFLRKAQANAKFKFVSTNVVDKSGNSPFSKFEIVNVGKVPVAVVSVTPETAKLGDGLKVLPPKQALESALKEIGTQAQLVVALSQLATHPENRALSTAVPGVNIWVGNDAKQTRDLGDSFGKALLLDGHRFGYYLGMVSIGLTLPITGFNSPKLIKVNQDILNGYEAAAKKQVDPAKKAAAEKRALAIKERGGIETIAGGSQFENELIALKEELYGTPNELTKWIAAEKERVREAAINAAPAAPAVRGSKRPADKK